jgi:O-antigen/teichoic acid export membrane protein
LFGSAVGGQFALAQRISAVPVTLVAGAVGQVFVARAARLAREEPAAMRTLFGRTTRSLALGAIIPFTIIGLLAPVLAAPVFGEAWRDAGLFVAILAPMFYLQLVTSPTGGTLDVLERQDLHLARELFRLSMVAGAVLIAATLGLHPIEALIVLSIAGCMTYVMYGMLSWRAVLTHRAPEYGTGP